MERSCCCHQIQSGKTSLVSQETSDSTNTTSHLTALGVLINTSKIVIQRSVNIDPCGNIVATARYCAGRTCQYTYISWQYVSHCPSSAPFQQVANYMPLPYNAGVSVDDLIYYYQAVIRRLLEYAVVCHSSFKRTITVTWGCSASCVANYRR